MENFNNIPSSGTYGAAIALINANFQLAKQMLERLEYSREGFCGMYDTSTDLEAAYPNPATGSFAYVGTDFPMAVYLVSNGSWYESSQEYDGGSIDLTQYASASSVTALAARVAVLEAAGYPLAGVANPSVAPDSSNHDKRYLFAWTPGTYSSYGQFTVGDGEFGILIYNGSSWSLSKTDLIAKGIAGGYDSEPTEDSTKPITSGAVYDALAELSATVPDLDSFSFSETVLYPEERINLSLKYGQDAVASFTFLAATASKAGLLSAADKAKVDAFLGNLRSIVFADTTASGDQATKITETLNITVGGVQEAVTTLQLLAATTSKAGLLSASDKAKLDNILTNIRSMVFADTTASADEGSKITETLKWTVGGAQEIITSLTILAATTSKAGLLSAEDKAIINKLWSTGYKYIGIATPSTTPISTDVNVFYIALEAGTYTGFGNLAVTQGINVLCYNGTSWTVALAIGIDDEAAIGSKNLIESNAVKLGDITNILPSDSMFDANSTVTESSVGLWQIRYPEDDSVVDNSSYMTVSLDGSTQSNPNHAIWIPGFLTAYTGCDVVVEFDAKGTSGDSLRLTIGPADNSESFVITDSWKHYSFTFEGITGSGANLGRVNLYNNTLDEIDVDIRNMRVKVNNEDIIRKLSDYQYMGIALPDDSAPQIEPGKKYFWFANKGGTYTNYGGLTVDFLQRAVILYNGTTWVKNTITGRDQNPYAWLLSIRSDGYIYIEDGYLHWKGLYFEKTYDGAHVHLTDGTHGWLVDNTVSTENNVLLYFEPDEISSNDAVVESSAFAASIGNIVPLGAINDQGELDTSSILGKALASYKERSASATERRRLDLVMGGIQVSDSTSGEYGEFDYTNEYGKRMWCTPRFIKVVSPKVTLYGDQFFEVSVVRYDKDFKTISNSTAKSSDEDNKVEMSIATYSAGSSSPVKYIRFYFQKRIGGERQYFKPTIYADGIGEDVFAKIQDTPLLRFSYDNTYHARVQFPKMVYTYGMEDYPWLPLSIPVNYTNPYSSDGNQTVVKDSENYIYDYGFLALPATYSNTGKPTRLIIFCHGSSMHYTKGCKTINTGRMGADPAYWLSEGYAVMDMEGSPFGYESGTTRYPHDNIPQSIECYRAGYEFVIKAFNICRDGVFIGGRSLGAGMATSLINSSGIPVLAAVLNAPTRVCEISFFKSRNAARRAYEAYYKGFSKTGTLSDDETWWGTGTLNQTKLDFLTAHKEKILMYSSYTRLIQNFPAWSDYIALANGDTFNSQTDRDAVLAAYANSIIKSDIPIKIFASPSDNVVDYHVGAELLYKMTCAGGTISELRMFPAHDDQSDPYAGEPIDTGHPFDLYYGNRVASYTNTRGLALQDVPIAYIEALQFWRRFENNLG